MDIINRIKDLAFERGWSVYQLSNEADIGQSTLTNMFTRKTLPSLVTLEKLCNAFGITLSQFFEDENGGCKLSLQEKELLSNFRKLSKDKQKHLIGLIR